MNTFWVLLLAAVLVILCVTFGCLIAFGLQKKQSKNIPTIELIPDSSETKENQSPSTSGEEEILPDKEGEYTGVLHISNNGHKFERPVMGVKAKRGNKTVYFEYNEKGEKVYLNKNKNVYENLIKILKDHSYKCKTLKWYPIEGTK